MLPHPSDLALSPLLWENGKRLNPGPTPGLGKAAPGVCEGRGLAATHRPAPTSM